MGLGKRERGHRVKIAQRPNVKLNMALGIGVFNGQEQGETGHMGIGHRSNGNRGHRAQGHRTICALEQRDFGARGT